MRHWFYKLILRKRGIWTLHKSENWPVYGCKKLTSVACSVGDLIVLSEQFLQFGTVEQIEAVIEHERAHGFKWHGFRQLMVNIFMSDFSASASREYELEADDYAKSLGMGVPLADALERFSLVIMRTETHPSIQERIRRLRS